MHNPRVLILAPTCKYGITGIGVCVEAVIEELSRRKNSFTVVEMGAPLTDGAVGQWGASKALRQFNRILVFARHLVQNDIVYLTISSSPLGLLRDCMAVALATMMRRPVVGHLHGGGFRAQFERSSKLMKWLIGRALARVDKVIVLSENLRSQFEGLVGNSRICVIANGIDSPLAKETVESYLMKRLDGGLKLIYLSNLIPSKGYVEAVQATWFLRDEHGLDASIVLCGEEIVTNADSGSGHFPSDQFKLQTGDGKEVVRLAGPVSGDEKWNALVGADVLLLPTSYEWEGQPLCIIEAMSCGTPVVSTDHKGIPEMMESDREGILVDEPKPELIAAAVVRITADKERYLEYARAARQRYERDYRVETFVGNVIDEFHNVYGQ